MEQNVSLGPVLAHQREKGKINAKNNFSKTSFCILVVYRFLKNITTS